MQIEMMKTADLIPYVNNPRNNDAAVDAVASSIKNFGFKVPIIIDSKGEIITGHTRLKAATKLGMDEVPVIRADDLTPAQVKAFRLADNKVAELAEWDYDLLKIELDGIEGIDMTDFGFDEPASDHKSDEPYDDNYDPDDHTIEPKTKRGDIYILGDHRLMCGDSTKAEDVAKLMDGVKADLFLTDPPYNVAIGDKMKRLGGSVQTNIAGDADGKSDEQVADDLWTPAFSNALQVAKDRCSIYMSMPQGGTHMMMMMSAREAGWQVKHELIWVKNTAVFSMGRLDYDYRHEPILYGWNKSHAFYAEDYRTSVLDNTKDIDKLTKDEMQQILHNIVDSTSVIYEDKPRVSDLHPTMKPIPLFGRLIKNSSQKGDIVLDLFGGSGTTLMACEELDRTCYMMEYDPHYCDVIIDRWEQMTGQKAEKIN